MPWLWIWIAAAFEIVWAIGLKMSDGFSKLTPSIVTIVAYLASLVFLSLGMKNLPVGTSYAVWTGVGAAGTAVVGILWFQESRDPVRIIFLLVISCGVAGLMLTESVAGRK
jgi:quaternary ammonium compound-resistance protein SugE